MTLVDAITLRQGAWYALEQAGRLLAAAVIIAGSGDRVTAVVLAMFGREEIGRSKILQVLATQVDAGASLSPADVRGASDDHIGKQTAGNLSTTIRSTTRSALDKAARAALVTEVGSTAWVTAEQMARRSVAAKRKRDPEARHSARMATLYVDLDDAAKWRRPIHWSQSEAHKLIVDATNDYACERDRLETLAADYPEMAAARASLEADFNLPLPPRVTWAG